VTPAVWFALLATDAVIGALLFGAAGTLQWPAAWVFLAEVAGSSLALTIALARDDPALLAERMKPPVQREQAPFDRIVMPLLLVLFPLWLILMGLDAGRFHWSAVPVWLQALGGVTFLGAMWIIHLAVRANTFAAPVVKIATERGQHVISSGPYAIVRHPMYAGVLVYFVSAAVLLGSWYGCVGSLVLAAVLVVRTVLEERELTQKLEGYAAYAAHVRYRFVPFLW
jgi:protein-S-isoprenylcysteine O-methyltransferase Ste14